MNSKTRTDICHIQMLLVNVIIYLVKSPFGVSQESDAVSLCDTDCHCGEMGSGGVPHSFSFQRYPARHWTWGVVRATGISLQGVL